MNEIRMHLEWALHVQNINIEMNIDAETKTVKDFRAPPSCGVCIF